ncbi:hypothetical protein BDR03DRAFT_966275, partial [Suillus americanus]
MEMLESMPSSCLPRLDQGRELLIPEQINAVNGVDQLGTMRYISCHRTGDHLHPRTASFLASPIFPGCSAICSYPTVENQAR